MSEFRELMDALVQFRDARDWAQFHNPKDLAIALSTEAGELLECFLWKQPHEAKTEKIRVELADVIAYALLLAHECNLDVTEIVEEKIRRNAEKYPVDKAKGNAKKYDEL